jgi:hypothetical protein
MAVELTVFFLISDYRNIDYRMVEFEIPYPTIGYQIKTSIYRIIG